jgi:hypothetical protein
MLKSKKIKKFVLATLTSVLLFTNIQAFAEDTYTFESSLGYSVNFDENQIEVKSENSKDFYYYGESKISGPVISKVDKDKKTILEDKYEELNENITDADYLKNLMPDDFKDRKLQATEEINKTDDFIELEIQMHTGEYFIPFYNIKYIYKKDTENSSFEIVYPYFTESVEGSSYKEMNSLLDSFESLNSNENQSEDENTSTETTENPDSKTEPEASVTGTKNPTENNNSLNLLNLSSINPIIYVVIFFVFLFILAIIITLKKQKK